MRIGPSHINQKNRRALGPLWLLLLYLSAQYAPWFAHALAHTDGHTHHGHTHTAAEEQDPCHRSIYHAGQGEACEHPSHLSTLELSCSWDFYTLLPYYLSWGDPPEEFQELISSLRVLASSIVPGTDTLCRFLRGPPPPSSVTAVA